MSNGVLTPSFSRVGATTQIDGVPVPATIVVDGNGVPIIPTATTEIAAGTSTSSTVVRTGAGRLGRVLITTAGAAALTFHDGIDSTGTVIAVVPADTTVGTTLAFNTPAMTGITAAVVDGTPGVTLSYC